VADHVFVSDRVLLDVGFGSARARLGMLARDGVLLQASEVAYGEGIAGMAEAAGSRAGMSRLAGICAEALAGTEDGARIGMRWDAIAADGKLFAALDADLMLTPAGEQITVLALAGAYRPPPGPVGAELDHALVHRCAAAVIRSFLARTACALGLSGPGEGCEELGRGTRRAERPCPGGTVVPAARAVRAARTGPLPVLRPGWPA